MILKLPLLRLVCLAATLCLSAQSLAAEQRNYRDHTMSEDSLTVQTSEGEVTLTPVGPSALSVHYRREGLKQLPSFALATSSAGRSEATLEQQGDKLVYRTGSLTAVIHKSPFRIEYCAAANKS